MSDVPQPRSEEEIAATVAKIQAETAQALAAADLDRVNAQKAAAEARAAEVAALTAELNLEDVKLNRELKRAGNEYHRIYQFNDSVTSASVRSCIAVLTQWSRVYPGQSMEIVFNSPGGSIIDGLALFDFLQELRRRGHHITTSAQGMAASMAGILLQAGDKRVMSRESWLLIHEAAFMAGGKIGDVEDTVEWVQKIQSRVLAIFAARSNLSATQIKTRWRRKDWWIDSDEALKLGFIDEIR